MTRRLNPVEAGRFGVGRGERLAAFPDSVRNRGCKRYVADAKQIPLDQGLHRETGVDSRFGCLRTEP